MSGRKAAGTERSYTMFFDEVASSYDHWYETPLGSFADEVETALAFGLFEVRPGALILDAGCGTGNFSLKLARKGALVAGIDLSPGMLTLGREKAAREGLLGDSAKRFSPLEKGGRGGWITFSLMDIYRLDFPPDCFDGVVSMAAFEFIHEPQRAFGELMRVLKPGGALLIGTISRDSAWGIQYMKQAQRKGSIFRHARFITLKELKALDQENLVGSGECLFIEPGASPERISVEEEERMSLTGAKGGFIAASWRKPLS